MPGTHAVTLSDPHRHPLTHVPLTHVPLTKGDDLIALLRQGRAHAESAAAGAVDQLAHGLQCALELQLAAPDDIELQLAGLVHDIGHLLAPGDDAGHGRVASDAVRHLLGERIARLVELHVPAKRYLVATDPAYRDLLSPTSAVTLGRQGGGMSSDEVAAFAALPECADASLLRRADEAAKVANRVVPHLDTWRPALLAVAETPAS